MGRVVLRLLNRTVLPRFPRLRIDFNNTLASRSRKLPVRSSRWPSWAYWVALIRPSCLPHVGVVIMVDIAFVAVIGYHERREIAKWPYQHL